jgi:DNA (cytosine-5)-methyltransferase 1
MIPAADLFSGLGGFSEGARSAGVAVRMAANHWPSILQQVAA